MGYKYLEPLRQGHHEGRIVKIKEGEHANKLGVVVYSDNLGKFHTVHAIGSRNDVSWGYHPTSNLLYAEKPLREDNIPSIGDRVSTIRGSGVRGRIQNIADNGKGIETAFVKTDQGEIVPTPLSNIKMESTLQKVRRILAEAALLLEYNDEKNWAKFGPKISERLSAEGLHPDQHREVFNRAIEDADPTHNKQYSNWISDKFASGGIGRLEDIGTRVKPALAAFHAHNLERTSRNLPVEKKMRDFQNLGELTSHVHSIEQKPAETFAEPVDKRQASAMKHLAGENEHWQHFQLKHGVATHEDSRYLAQHHAGGSGGNGDDTCEWCTAQNGDQSKDTMNHYLQDGDLHIFIPKQPRDNAERYQSHFESNQFMDKKDNTVSPQKVFADRPYPQSYQNVIDHHLRSIFGE